jgi:hypothetical protein
MPQLRLSELANRNVHRLYPQQKHTACYTNTYLGSCLHFQLLLSHSRHLCESSQAPLRYILVASGSSSLQPVHYFLSEPHIHYYLHIIYHTEISQPVTMPALHFHTERLEFEDPENPSGDWGTVFTILRDYVQPDSTLSLDEAVDRAAEFYTDGYRKNSPINQISIILGDQIPYDNPAHAKLAHFLLALGESRKWFAKSAHVRTLC